MQAEIGPDGKFLPQVDRDELRRLLENGCDVKEVAQRFKVRAPHIRKIIKNELRIQCVVDVSPREAKAAMMLEKAHKEVEQSLDAIAQLARINEVANGQLDELVGDHATIDRMTDAIAEALKNDDINPNKGVLKQLVRDISKNRELAFRAMAEIRGQLNLQLEMLKTFNDLEATADFQRQVLEAIGEIAPDVRNKIIQKLKERRTLRQSVKLV